MYDTEILTRPKLFTTVDITEDVMLAIGNVPDRVEEMMAVIRETECPAPAIGLHCKDPYECSLTDCWEGLPEDHVFTLYRARLTKTGSGPRRMT